MMINRHDILTNYPSKSFVPTRRIFVIPKIKLGGLFGQRHLANRCYIGFDMFHTGAKVFALWKSVDILYIQIRNERSQGLLSNMHSFQLPRFCHNHCSMFSIIIQIFQPKNKHFIWILLYYRVGGKTQLAKSALNYWSKRARTSTWKSADPSAKSQTTATSPSGYKMAEPPSKLRSYVPCGEEEVRLGLRNTLRTLSISKRAWYRVKQDKLAVPYHWREHRHHNIPPDVVIGRLWQ